MSALATEIDAAVLRELLKALLLAAMINRIITCSPNRHTHPDQHSSLEKDFLDARATFE